MRKKEDALIITFLTTADAMALERYAGKKGLPGRIIPLPVQISAGCGLAWKAPPESGALWRRCLEEEGLRWETMRVLAVY